MTISSTTSSAWVLPSPTIDHSRQNNDNNNLDRRSLLQALGISTAALSSLTELQPKLAGADNTPTLAGREMGILWRTQPGRALPANPATVLKIFQKEVLGTKSLAGNSMKSLPTEGIICVSERHDDFEHHRVQLRVIQTMYKALQERVDSSTTQSKKVLSSKGNTSHNTVGKKLSIAMEAFQRKDRASLEKYIKSGESGRYTLADLKRDTNWDENWGYDMLHYVPILKYAQKKGIRLIGLQPSNDEVASVEKNGLAGISAAVVGKVVMSDKAHKEQFEKLFAPNFSLEKDFGGCPEAFDAHIQRLYEVQCFREEYMAESAALHMDKQYYSSGGPGWVTILAGENHVLGRNGIPFRALRRVAIKRTAMNKNQDNHYKKNKKNFSLPVSNRGVFTIVPRAISFPIGLKEAPGISSADYVWFLERDPRIAFDEKKINLAPRQAMSTV